jgi:hypothetical protein
MANKTFNIQNAVAGKIKYLASTYVDGLYEGIFKSGSYLYAACGTSGLRAYTFNGTSFTLIDTDVFGGTSYKDVWSDGTYIYCTCSGGSTGGLRVYSFNGSVLTYRTTYSGVSLTFRKVYGDGTYIYATDSIQLYAFSYNGTTLSQIGFWADTGSETGDLWCGNGYIYLTKGSINVFSFNGSSFTLNSTKTISGQAFFVIWGVVNGSSNNIYTSTQGEYLHLFTGTTTLATVKTYYEEIVAQDIKGVWGDEKYIYQAGGTRGLATYIASTPTIQRPCLQNRQILNLRHVTGDANYIYTTSPTGLHAYKLFEKYQ